MKYFLLVFVTFFNLIIANAIVPFKINVSDDALKDLNKRLSTTRMADQLKNTTWEYGTSQQELQNLIHHWKTKYDWKQREKYLNTFPHFKTKINNLNIHFIHKKSKKPNSKTIIMLHGWPGSFVECLTVINSLTESKGKENFNFVCPSLPGYGFSDKPTEKGFDIKKIALTFVKLMERLNYTEYIVQGGDWGSFIATIMASNDKKHCKAVHINFAAANPPQKTIFQMIKTGLTYLFPRLFLSEIEIELLTRSMEKLVSGIGYFVLQSTKPQTISYALNDSPVGLAAYIFEKFHGWSEDYKKIDKNLILDNIMIYWVTETISSSVRTYYEFVHVYGLRNSEDFIEQPTGYLGLPFDLSMSPKSWLLYKYNLIRYNLKNRGGHFASLEETEIFVEDVREFIGDVQKITKLRYQNEL
eukprot:gene498-8012_t